MSEKIKKYTILADFGHSSPIISQANFKIYHISKASTPIVKGWNLGGVVLSCAVLVATDVVEDGKRTILGTSVSLSEAEVHWRNFLLDLKKRGLHGVQLITSYDHSGLKAVLTSVFPSVP